MPRVSYVGLDAHRSTIAVAMLLPGQRNAIEWEVENEAQSLRRLAKKILKLGEGEVRACYEAGPVGFALKRELDGQGVACEVIAPALIPERAGDRVKTDRRDALKLARLLRAGLLTEVHTPTPADEAARDLCRAREDAAEDRSRCRHRLQKMLLRYGVAYGPGTLWTQVHRQWLAQVRFGEAAAQATYDEYLRAVEWADERVRSLEERIASIAEEPRYRDAVGALRCFRGVETLTAMSFVAELGDPARFGSARQLMAYLGLTPSEHSSGGKHRRGGITKAGNGHVRRLLIESSWHYRHWPSVGKKLQQRRAGQPAWAVAAADRAQQRLCRRFRWLTGRGKASPEAVVAVARELAGFLWAVQLRASEEVLAA